MSKVGKALGNLFLKGDINAAFKSLSANDDDDITGRFPIIIDPSLRWTPDNQPWEYDGRSGHEYFKWEGYSSSAFAYERCAPLQSIINRMASQYTNGETWWLNDQDKVSKSSEALKLRKLWRNPNPILSQKAFEAQMFVYVKTFGYSILLFRKPSGYKKNIDAYNMWNIPPSMVKIKETEKPFFYQTDLKGIVDEITITYNGDDEKVKLEDIFIVRDNIPSFSSLVVPESRICSLKQVINNIIGAYESRGLFINERGAMGILTPEMPKDGLYPAPAVAGDKEDLQRQFRKYGTRVGQHKYIIAKTALKWLQMGTPIKDLMLFEEIKDDVMALCDSYNYDYRLLANDSNNSLGGTDANIFLKKSYQDSIIPDAMSIAEQLTSAFGLENIRCNKDYSKVPCLQEDETAKATARKVRNDAYRTEFELGACTLNDLRVANGEDPNSEPQFSMYYEEYQKWKRDTYPVEQPTDGTGQESQGQQGSLVAV